MVIMPKSVFTETVTIIWKESPKWLKVMAFVSLCAGSVFTFGGDYREIRNNSKEVSIIKKELAAQKTEINELKAMKTQMMSMDRKLDILIGREGS